MLYCRCSSYLWWNWQIIFLRSRELYLDHSLPTSHTHQHVDMSTCEEWRRLQPLALVTYTPGTAAVIISGKCSTLSPTWSTYTLVVHRCRHQIHFIFSIFSAWWLLSRSPHTSNKILAECKRHWGRPQTSRTDRHNDVRYLKRDSAPNRPEGEEQVIRHRSQQVTRPAQHTYYLLVAELSRLGR